MTRKRRRRRGSQSGFALLVVVILLALMTAATALALDNAVASMRTHAGDQASEIIQSALDYGVAQAVAQVKQDDVELLINPAAHPNLTLGAADFDIFSVDRSVTHSPYIAVPAYPPAPSPYAGLYNVRVGIRSAQRGRAPAGEDVRGSYGQVLELQVEVQANGAGVPPAEDRLSLGIMVPRRVANAK